MNIRIPLVTACIAAAMGTAAAQEPLPSFPAVQAKTVLYVANCDHRSLPSQRAVGEWTGQNNFGQVYATRARLMGDISRACMKPGIKRVNLVMGNDPPAATGHERLVAQIAAVVD